MRDAAANSTNRAGARILGALLAGLCLGSPLAAQESRFLYGIHDHDTGIQEYLDRLNGAGVQGWVTATVAIGSNPDDTGGDDFRFIADQGHSVIVRLNNGYCGSGTIPTPDKYDDFARRAANYVAATQGADIFVIGNETNLAVEWPPVGGHASYVSPQSYATAFRKVYDAIKAVRPDARVMPQALAPFAGPYSAGSTCGYSHDANPLNWVQYMREMLDAIRASGGIDGIALHVNSRGYTLGDIHSTQKVSAGGQDLYFSFYVYKDWVDLGIPEELYHLPLYATESNGIYYWSGGHPERPDSHYERGWMQEIYAEIHRYNQEAAGLGKPIFRAVNMYRWCAWCDGWNIDSSPYKGDILADLDEALAAGYRWPEASGGTPPTVPEGTNVALDAVNWWASSTFSGATGGDKAYDGVVSEGSKWTSDGAAAESWLALDLGVSHAISGFVVRHAGTGGEPDYFNTAGLRLESGESPSGPWQVLATVDNGAGADTSVVVLTAHAESRYVRLYVSDAGIDNHARIPEFEVYATDSGTPDDPPPADTPSGENLALGAVDWAASSTFSIGSGGDKAYDGVVSEGSKWTSDGGSVESWLALDLGAEHAVNGFIVRHAGDAGEPGYFNTEGFRLEMGESLDGPWQTLAAVANVDQENVSITILESDVTARFVKLHVTDAGIDDYARIPELEVYGSAVVVSENLIVNGDFDSGLAGWSPWSERGVSNQRIENGQLAVGSADHNGGMYQQFDTGGPGKTITVDGVWSSNPSAANNQWAEVLVINGPRLPVNGEDLTEAQGDVVLIYKNDTWASPGGWSGNMADTASVAGDGSFVSTAGVATIVLKSGNIGGIHTGTRFDDIVVRNAGGGAPVNGAPSAHIAADPTVGSAPLTVNFDASASSDPDGDPLTFTWDLGDGAGAVGESVAHTYENAGTYVVRLTVIDDRGGSDEASVTISVGDNTLVMPDFCPPVLDFPTIRVQLAEQGKTLVHSKIGFHVGPAGNQNGLGEWMQCLDAAGVPFMLKSADSAGQILEGAQLREASGVPHVLVYRKASITSSDADQHWDPGVPEYHRPAPEAAALHWQRHRDVFPPELEPYKHLIWVETINEVDKNRAEWLAEFSYHTALLAMEEGFNWAAFSWSSGEPEPSQWRGPEMRRFLELAGANPQRVAVALHEYSYVTDSLDRDFPYLVGRFQDLFAAADEIGVPRPTVLITEFGWAYQNIASVGQAMEVDLPWADQLYALHPEIKGAAIWYLGPGFGGIANQAQQLIAPVTEYGLQNYHTLMDEK
jgi:PKD repeat protein